MATTDQLPRTRGEVPCSYHPAVMTGLRCSRCGKPICPRCGVRTPVGMRCPDCAGVRGLPTYQTDATVLARTAGVGLAVAVPVGVLWGFAPGWGFWLALLLGFGVVEAMAWACNAKRGRDLQLLAFALVAVGLVVSRYVMAQRFGIGLDEVNRIDDPVFTREVVQEYGGGLPADYLLRLRPIPDLLFAVIPFLIGWVRFR